jgi:hypothetical protein
MPLDEVAAAATVGAGTSATGRGAGSATSGRLNGAQRRQAAPTMFQQFGQAA